MNDKELIEELKSEIAKLRRELTWVCFCTIILVLII